MILSINSLKYGKFNVLVDDDISLDILNIKWRITTQYGGKFRVCKQTYLKNYKTKTIYLHRLIVNAKKGEYVDHINGNPLDNRRANLRICTNAENIRNSKIRKNNKSGYIGVSYYNSTKKYHAEIRHNYKKIKLGSFATKEEAAMAYNKAAIKYHGKFASLNIIKN